MDYVHFIIYSASGGGRFIIWTVFEIIGVIAFAISGALVAIEKKLDIFGVMMLAVTTAIGGGIIRDVLIGNTPPLTFRDPTFFLISVGSAILTVLYYHRIRKLKNIILICDAVGLGAFTVTSANIALGHNLDSLFMVTAVAVITSIGGGVLRDMFAQEIPLVFRKEVYALAAILGAVAYYYLRGFMPGNIPLYLGFAITLAIRMFAIKYDINLPPIDGKATGHNAL